MLGTIETTRSPCSAAATALAVAQSISASGVLNRKAGTTIPPSTVVVGLGDFVVPASPYTQAHRGLVQGVVRAGAAAGADVLVQQLGDLDGVTGAFGPNDTLCIASDGALTNSPPTLGWIQSVAVATTSSRIVINLGTARKILPGGGLILSGSPAAAQAALIAILDTAPFWDRNPATYPTAPGLYRQGDVNGYTILVVK